MSILTRVECDLCGLGVSAAAGTDPDELRADEGLTVVEVDGSLLDAHPACVREREAGRDPSLLDGLPGLACQ